LLEWCSDSTNNLCFGNACVWTWKLLTHIFFISLSFNEHKCHFCRWYSVHRLLLFAFYRKKRGIDGLQVVKLSDENKSIIEYHMSFCVKKKKDSTKHFL
jgi:hypothetical protein